MPIIVKPGITVEDVLLAADLSLKGALGDEIQFEARDGDIIRITRDTAFIADPRNPPPDLEKLQQIMADLPIELIAGILDMGVAIANGFAQKVLLTDGSNSGQV